MNHALVSICLLLALPALAQTEPPKSELKVLTWNIFMIPKPVNWTYQQERAKVIAKKMAGSELDVMFFQEAFSTASKKKILKGLKSSHPYSAEPCGRKFGSIQSSGLLVLSKYPMRVLDEVVFKDCSGSDCLARKSAILVEVTHPSGKKAQFVNTHLQAWNHEKAMKVRRSQFTQIRELMQRHKQETIPQFLVGDLNVDGLKEEEFQASLKLLNMEATPLSGEERATNGFKVDCYKVPGSETEGEWLDHLWAQKNQSAIVKSSKVQKMSGNLRVGDCPLSDHHAVESVIEL